MALNYAKGDIVLAPFPFTDLSGSKLRPALVFCSYREDLILIFISSAIKTFDEFNVFIKKSGQNGLKADSVLKLSKIATLDKNLVAGRIGGLEIPILKEAARRLTKMIG